MRSYFIENRNKIFAKMQNNSVMFLFSGKEVQKSGEENYPFCVNKNFYYLTGLEKPNIYLILEKTNNEVLAKIITPQFKKSAWVSPVYTIKQVQSLSGVQNVEYYENVYQVQPLKDKINYFDFSHNNLSYTYDNFNISDCFKMIACCRAVKNEYEIKQIKKAIDITHKGLLKLFSHLSTCKFEYQAQALFEGEIMFYNSHGLAFATICAGGKNACTLHYSKNTDKLNEGELLLLDLGARYCQFSSDISRTIPYKSKFSPLQKQLYNMVLKAQKIGLKMAKPNVTIYEINEKIIDFYFVELKKLGIVKVREDVKKYYMHYVGHSLGLNTHDEGLLRNEKLVAGNVITMEPGIYVEKLKIGIRIEDNVLITENGNIVLSRHIPKTIEDIEKLVK